MTSEHTYPPDPDNVGGITDEQLADAEFFDLEPINDDAWAEWAMRRVVAAQQRIMDTTMKRDAWLRPIVEWYDNATASDRRIVERLTESLQHYAIAERTRTNDKRKTIDLPSGSISTTRATTPRIEIGDEKAVLVWCENNLTGAEYDVCVSTHPSALISELRKVLRIIDTEGDDGPGRAVVLADGTFAEGFTIVDPETTASVRVRHE